MKLHVIALATAALTTNIVIGSPAANAEPTAFATQRNQGNISYVTGGVGEDEAAALKRAAPEFPLEVQFVQRATPRDEFLAGVKVEIRDRSGKVLLDTVSDGPFLLAQLPAGTYQIEANHDGVAKRQTVEIRAGKHARAVFVWATSDETSKATLNSAVGGSNYR
jgi:hypothetical protein